MTFISVLIQTRRQGRTGTTYERVNASGGNFFDSIRAILLFIQEKRANMRLINGSFTLSCLKYNVYYRGKKFVTLILAIFYRYAELYFLNFPVPRKVF